MGINKIVYGGVTKLDISNDTVTPSSLLQGYTAHDNTGALITGTATSGGTGAVSVVDTEDTNGGTIRTITAVDISDTTAVASDVASGKYFYTADGTKTAGTASGGSATIQSLSVTQNGTYTAPSGVDGYSPVTVNVSGGGGASPWTLIHSEELTVSTTSTSDSSTKAITLSGIYTSSKILYVRIRDKAGKRAGYFYGTDNFIINPNPANGGTATVSTFIARYVIRYTSSNMFQSSLYSGVNGYGVYVYNLTSSGKLNLHQRYNTSSSLTIDGTYTVEVYTLDWPDGISPFDA